MSVPAPTLCSVGMWEPLIVDPAAQAAELRRFASWVVCGPGVDDCAIWVGAIGADGYGRFWIHRGARRIMVRANRYALQRPSKAQPWSRRSGPCTGATTRCVRVSQPGEVGLLHVV